MSNEKPMIRVAKPGDEAGIHEAHMRSIREVCVRDHGDDEVSGWGNRPLGNRWIQPIRDGHVWVVEWQGVIHGFAYIEILAKDGKATAYIYALYLTPEVLGQGLGRRLTELMIDKAREAKASEIELDSTLTAHGFYRRMGFEDSGPLEKHEIGGSWVRGYPMKIKLR